MSTLIHILDVSSALQNHLMRATSTDMCCSPKDGNSVCLTLKEVPSHLRAMLGQGDVTTDTGQVRKLRNLAVDRPSSGPSISFLSFMTQVQLLNLLVAVFPWW